MSTLYKSFVILMLLGLTIVSAAQEACPSIVQDALAQIQDACNTLGRNEACYGNGNILALDPSGQELSNFNAAGDVTELLNLSSLELSGLDELESLWGVAVLSIQANIPNTLPGQNVTMLMFGDSQLQTSPDDASAFFFSTGIGQLACDEAPNGLLIQTPEGVGEINLSLNNISIDLGSTAYITAEADGDFNFALLEGHASLGSGEDEIEVAGGEFSTIPLDEDLKPMGDFSEVQAIASHLQLPLLPIQLLPRDISEFMPDSTTGERIVPQNGNWTVVLTDVNADAGCPAAMTSAFSSSLFNNESQFIDFGGADWDFETFFRDETISSGGMVLDGTFSSPATNVYLYEAVIEDMPFSFEMTVVSESYIEGTYTFDVSSLFAGCTITINYTVTLEE